MRAHPLRIVLTAAAAFAALGAPAYAQDDVWGADIAVMDDAEMGDLRGGFNINGIEIQFGVLITTILNGDIVLQTHFTIDDTGALIQQMSADLGVDFAELTDEQRAQFGVAGLDGANGIVLEGESGVTALIHNVSDRALQNIVVNTASDMDITQEFSVTLTLPGFEAVQADYDFASFGFSLNDDISGVRFGG